MASGCTSVGFIVTKISETPDIQGKWFNARIKLIMRLCIMMVLALMGHVLNEIFKMKFETHGYGIEFEIGNVLKSEMKRKKKKKRKEIEVHFEN